MRRFVPPPPPFPTPMPRQNVGQAVMLATLHEMLYEKVRLTVRPFVGQETTWTEADMVNHIVHYI